MAGHALHTEQSLLDWSVGSAVCDCSTKARQEFTGLTGHDDFRERAEAWFRAHIENKDPS